MTAKEKIEEIELVFNKLKTIGERVGISETDLKELAMIKQRMIGKVKREARKQLMNELESI